MRCPFPVIRIYYPLRKAFLALPTTECATSRVSDLLDRAKEYWNFSAPSLLRLVARSGCTLNLHADDIPLNICPNLSVIPRSDDRDRGHPLPVLELVEVRPENEAERGKMTLVLSCCDSDSRFLHNAIIKLRLASVTTRVFGSISGFLSEVHGQSPQDFAVFDCRGVDAHCAHLSASELIRNLLSSRYFVRCRLGDEAVKAIHDRCYPIETDLIKTEEDYVRTLNGFRENVEPVLAKIPSLSQTVVLDLLESAGRIFLLHTQLLHKLTERRRDFFYPLGEIFMPFSRELLLYQQYLGKYREIVDGIDRAAEKDRNVRELIAQFPQTAYADGLSLESVLIQPVQRGPRYPLILKEVIKKTPMRHPDYAALKKALRTTEASISKISGLILQASRFTEMGQLAAQIEGNAQVFEGNRWLVDHFEVQRASTKYLFVLFSDEFWILRGSQPVSRARYCDFWLEKYASKSVAHRSGALTTSYVCLNPSVRGRLIDQYREASASAQAKSAAYSSTAQWELYMEELALVFHSMAAMAGRIYIFGGLDEFSDPQNSLYEVTFAGPHTYTARKVATPTQPSPRYHAAMTSTDDALYVYGGTDDGTQGFGDFWRYDGTQWHHVETGSGDRPPTGFGLDLCWFPGQNGQKGDLLLTGVIGTFMFWKFSLQDLTWTSVEPDMPMPPYVGHKIFRIQDGCGLIVGGHTLDNGLFNNSVIWFSSFGRYSKILLCNGMPPTDRTWATYGKIKSYIFVVGGENEFQDFLIDVDCQQWSMPRNIGIKNSCPSFYGAACFCDEAAIWIHGGFSDTNQIQVAFYKVTLHTRDEVSDELPGLFWIQDCVKDDWVLNMMTNPASIKDESWIPTDKKPRRRMISGKEVD
jgi:hypothetical protein